MNRSHLANETESFNRTNGSVSVADHSQHTSLYIFSTLLEIIGFFSSACLLLALRQNRASHPSVRLLIANLATACILLNSFAFPALSTRTFLRSLGQRTRSDCYSFFPISHIGYIVLGWSDLALAINRLVAICFPVQYRHIRKVKISVLFIGVGWLIASTVVALSFNGTGLRYASGADGSCTLFLLTKSGAIVYQGSILAPYPLIGCIAIYIFAVILTRRQKAMHDTSPMTQEALKQQRTMRKRIAIAKAMFVSAIVCSCCTAPIFLLPPLLGSRIRNHPYLIMWMRLLMLLEGAVVPLIFIFISIAYRRLLIQKLFSVCSKKNSVDLQSCPPGHTALSGEGRMAQNNLLLPETSSHARRKSMFVDPEKSI